jgi:glyoxylase-like metal-dependent hydrolase (beta-lactamase superfamily II)
MSEVAYRSGLHEIANDTYAYLQAPGSWGLSNSGLVVAGDKAALVDTLFTLDLTQEMLDTIIEEIPQVSITTVINTHANGDHCWGNQLLPHAEIVGSAETADEMPHEISPAAMTNMLEQSPPDSPLGRYMRRFFGSYNFNGITLTPPTRTFRGQLSLPIGGRTVELTEVGPAHTEGDVIVHVPDVGVVFAGDVLFIGDHPVMWTGPIANWIRACDQLLATGATVVVPGHGPVTDPVGVARVRGYLQHVAKEAQASFERGVPYHEAAIEIDMGEYADWSHRERLVVTVGAIYRELGSPEPDSRLTMIEHMVRVHEMLLNSANPAQL